MQDELKVDMDWRPPEDWMKEWHFEANWLLLHQGAHIKKRVVQLSKHGYHIRFCLGYEIGDEMALWLQFLLGDDRVRCKLNYGRWMSGIEDWNKLWKCKVGRDNEK